MIVIRRKPGESLWVGAAEVRILSVSPSRVKLGVEAPRDLPVVRSEVAASCAQNRLAALTVQPVDLASLLDALRKDRG